jgi:hypothetical protein
MRLLIVLGAVALFTACSRPPAPAQSATTPAEKAAATPSTTQPPSATAAPPGTSAASAPASPAAAPSRADEKPALREVTIPSGTGLRVKLSTPIASDTSKVEDQVRGSLTNAVVIHGVTAVPAGSEIVGSVVEANPSGRVKGRASITFRFAHLAVGGENHAIQTAQIRREAPPDTKGDVKKGAIGAGAGAVVGGLVGGGKGAAIGAGVGGAGAVVATKGKEVRLPAGTTVTTTLRSPLKVLVPADR